MILIKDKQLETLYSNNDIETSDIAFEKLCKKSLPRKNKFKKSTLLPNIHPSFIKVVRSNTSVRINEFVISQNLLIITFPVCPRPSFQ